MNDFVTHPLFEDEEHARVVGKALEHSPYLSCSVEVSGPKRARTIVLVIADSYRDCVDRCVTRESVFAVQDAHHAARLGRG